MKLGKVIGQIIAPRKEGNLEGLRLFVVQYLDEQLKETKKTVACVDSVSANVGDIVLLCSSSSARYTRFTKNVCTDNTIVGIVDVISSGKEDWYRKDK